MRVLAVTNLYPSPQNPTWGTFVEQQVQSLRRIGMKVEVLFVDRVGKGMGTYLGLGRALRLRIAAFQPEIVHVMYGGVLAEVVTRVVRDRPVVVSFCGSDLLGDLLSGLFRKLIAGYGVFASHRAAKRACGVVVKSKNLLDALPGTLDRSKVRIIPNGVNLALFKPLDRKTCRSRLGWHNDRFHVLFPTNCGGDPRKRFDLALAAVEAANHSGIRVELHQLRGVAYDEVPIWLNASDVVLLTSLHEGSPNIIKEALACNRPVVSTDVGDVRERIERIEGCYLARPDPADLATKVRLVFNSARWIEGRAKMEELSVERIAQQLYDLYITLLNGAEDNQQTNNGETLHHASPPSKPGWRKYKPGSVRPKSERS